MQRGEPGGRSWAQGRAVGERRCGSAEPARPGACRRLPGRVPAGASRARPLLGGPAGPRSGDLEGRGRGAKGRARFGSEGRIKAAILSLGAPGQASSGNRSATRALQEVPGGLRPAARARRTGRASPSADPGGDEERPRGPGSAALVQPERLAAAARPASPFLLAGPRARPDGGGKGREPADCFARNAMRNVAPLVTGQHPETSGRRPDPRGWTKIQRCFETRKKKQLHLTAHVRASIFFFYVISLAQAPSRKVLLFDDSEE